MGTDPIFPARSYGKWGLSPFFLLGAASVFAFAPLGFYPLVLVSMAYLVHAWRESPPARCFASGYAFGLGFFGVGVSWIYVSLHEFGAMPAPLAALATLLFCAFLALFPAFAGWLQARIPASAAVRACLLIPAAWTLVEWLRSWILTGFPWLSVGYASVGWPLQGYAPLGGVFALSFLSVALAGMLLLAFVRRRWTWLAALAAVLLVGEALHRVPWTTPQGAPFNAALLQGNIEQSLKFDPARYGRTLETYARLAEETSARLIVFPETALPRFLDRVEPAYLERLAKHARRNSADILLGAPTRTAAGAYFNSVIALGASPGGVYHKVHLVPFGEFVPPLLGWTLELVHIPLADFSRGSLEQPLLDAAGQKIAVNVCYEDAFGDEIARRASDATLLVNASNVAWFGDSLAPAQHLQIARLRALETRRMHLAATNTGITAAIDRDGAVTARLPQFVEARLEARAQGYAGTTPYMRWLDWPVVIAALGTLIAAALVAAQRASR